MIYPYGLYYDPLILAVLAVFILGLIAQGGVTRTFSKYSKEPASSGLTGQEVAQRLLDQGGSSVTIRPVRGSLTDHFDPRNQTVGLSDSVYGSRSIAALAVAAHEIGHVMQYEEGYFPIRLRNAILPVASLGSGAAPWIVVLGLIFGMGDLAMAGVWLFGAVLAFQLITLPVELNASRRALAMLQDGGFLSYDETPAARKVLRAAAMTYVVAVLSALVSFLRLFLLARRSSRD